MAPRKINVIAWLIKSAEREVIRQSCLSNLVGLHFDLIYTMPYAMCLNTISEIFSTLEMEDDKNIISTSRFSNVGLVTGDEMEILQNRVADFAKETPVNVDIWQEVAGSYFETAVRKATVGLNKMFAELAKIEGNSFTVLIVNNDRMPLLELMAASLNKALMVPSGGEVVQMRFEGTIGAKRTDIKLVYASLHPVE